MVTLTEFFTELLTSALDLVQIFLNDVALSDPLSTVSFLMGALITTASIVVFGGLVLGALGDLLGVESTR